MSISILGGGESSVDWKRRGESFYVTTWGEGYQRHRCRKKKENRALGGTKDRQGQRGAFRSGGESQRWRRSSFFASLSFRLPSKGDQDHKERIAESTRGGRGWKKMYQPRTATKRMFSNREGSSRIKPKERTNNFGVLKRLKQIRAIDQDRKFKR